MKSMAKRVSIFVDPVPEVQHSASEDCLAESKSVGSCYRRRSSSLDNETRQRVHRKLLAEKVHSERMVGCYLLCQCFSGFVMAMILGRR